MTIPSVLEESSSTDSGSRSRVEEWLMEQDNNTNIGTTLGKVSIVKNLMRSDDYLIMVCPGCLSARVAASTEANKATFADLVTNITGNSMVGLVVSAYCSLRSDRCAKLDTSTDRHTHKLLSDFESWSGCKSIGKILRQVTYVRSDTDEDEIMVLSAREIVRLCKGMQMSPLKFECDGIVIREDGDRWMNMDWTINRIPTRVKVSSAGKSLDETSM
ncbi:hypothetical protein LTR91_015331 [Friedmanniomyces endolithicus]|uniref:Uncharacterized protein n=1 Tax=Friedmanniomyces endolithicus TaxID=329885 RepID=A0AAN6KA89_9PEZI|nr:hypothetical protein LTR59_005469 [Friedmanniomyces endolithicus]KAK0808219.1 hypothetical protein LTR38_004685 [Friedmanniomyces endolithicus]KAK0809092.1 hypothetical protein LTR75_006034 [Friedmanniomyces endolithicus]KAK0917979.1 hypothetical protein LTR57_012130 [Friedmanniomyces endolithicus]KAK0971934.1 hypothetical protein LTR91_015331 [Friedmanniomyces endolithicus]